MKSIFIFSSLALSLIVTPLAEARIIYKGGDGRSPKNAVVITGAKGELDGVASEYQWIKQNRPDWSVVQQAVSINGRKLDILTIEKQGKTANIYFDISSFFGKLK